MTSSTITVNFSESDEGLFTPAEIRRLIGIEYDRAQRYEYPISLILIDIDRLEYLHDLYGQDSKEEILQAVLSLLRTITRASDFLGCMRDGRILAVFPHASARDVTPLAGRLLRSVRDLTFRSGSRSLRTTLSIGISVTHVGELPDFEVFVNTAEDALAFAIDSGGDRFVLREPASAVIQELREDLEAESERLKEEGRHAAAAGAAVGPGPARFEDVVVAPPASVEGEVKSLFDRLENPTPELVALRAEVVVAMDAAVRRAVLHQARTSAEESARQVDVLERRVNKLKEILDATEAELAAMARAKGIDSGVASIYRTVQGLPEQESEYEKKKELLTLIFESNVELRRKIRRDS